MSFEYADESDRGRYPIPRGVADRGRRAVGRRPPRARRGPRALQALRAVRRLPASRRRAGTPARARSGTCARTGCARAAGPPPTPPGCRSCPGSRATTRCAAAASTTRCASRRRDPARVRLPGAPLRLDLDRPGPAADGPALAAEARLRHLALPAPGADRAAGAEALRDDPRRQRLVLVRERRAEPRLGQRRPALAARACRAAPSRSWTRPVCPGPARLAACGRSGSAARAGTTTTGGAALPGGPGQATLARALRAGLRHRRGELDLLPAPLARGRRALGRADAARLRVRGQGEPLPDPRQAPAGSGRGIERFYERASSRSSSPASSGRSLWQLPRELPARRRAARRRARRAAAGPALLRVPPRELVRAERLRAACARTASRS